MKSRQKTRKMVLLALFCCIEVVLMLTPLGYIPLGVVRATTLHIPVILAGILLGGHAGGIVGLVFGVSSVIVNTLTPTVTSFVFSPFYSVGEIHGGAASLLIALGPRILLGYSASWIFRMMMKLTGRLSGSLTVSAMHVSAYCAGHAGHFCVFQRTVCGSQRDSCFRAGGIADDGDFYQWGTGNADRSVSCAGCR